jgi:hypothetical protein
MQLLKLRKHSAVGILELLWHFTARYCPQGDIGKFSDEQIASAVDWRGSVPQLIDTLLIARLLDKNEKCRLYVHDWHDHSDDGANKWLERNGLTYANGLPPRGHKSRNVAPCLDISRKVRRNPEMSRLSEPMPQPEPHSHSVAAVSGHSEDEAHRILVEVFPTLKLEDDLIARQFAPGLDYARVARDCVRVAANDVGGIRNPFTYWRSFLDREKRKEGAAEKDETGGRGVYREGEA